MQLFALDENRQLVSASCALKQIDYCCIECGHTVRLRAGHHRKKHYYHLQNGQCSLNRKSMEHIQIQSHLSNLLPAGECVLECRFPQVGRIADVAWHSERLIFEVQCSPISEKEVRERILDYQKCGYQVVWILHEKTFNQWKLCAAEDYLQKFPHYFTNMDCDGEGMIYDYYAGIYKGLRKKKLAPLLVQLNCPVRLNEKRRDAALPFLSNRLQAWEFCFLGDLIDLYMQNPTAAYWLEAQKIRDPDQTIAPFRWYQWINVLIRSYFILWRLILEKYCR